MASSKKDLSASISSLKLDPKKPKKPVIVESWEDEDLSASEDESSSPNTNNRSSSISTSTSSKLPNAPPPTPISPTYNNKVSSQPWPSTAETHILEEEDEDEEEGHDGTSRRRPEKTDVVARRMIAGALGLKAPKPTEEQRAYEKAIREQERKRKEQEREAERKRLEEVEKAKAAIWDD